MKKRKWLIITGIVILGLLFFGCPDVDKKDKNEDKGVSITFNSQVDFDGVTAQYSVTGTSSLTITLTNHAQYTAVYYILNENTPKQVTNGLISIPSTELQKSNYLLIVVSIGGFEYSKPINITKN